MADIYVINTLDNKRAVPQGFATKSEAKVIRNKLITDGTICVVSKGPDHYYGSSRVDPGCLSIDRVSHKRKRQKKRPIELIGSIISEK